MSIESLRPPHDGAIPQYADFLGRIVPFSGAALTLDEDMNGMILRSDGASAVTVTVPSTLPLGFNCGFIMYGAGTVTLSSGGGMTNRSGKTALSIQYQAGSIFVAKSGEFIVGGDFA